MLNQVVLVGRLTSDLELKEVNNRKECLVTLAVSRTFKNADGEYDTDFIPITLFGSIAENTSEYCKKGDIVGVKGRIESEENNIKLKVTFLSSKSKDE